MKKIDFKYRLFGRSKGRKKNNNISDEVKKIIINSINPNNYNIIDIGSGYGESTLEFAKQNKFKIIISCEKYIDGLNNIARECKIYSLSNVHVFNGNVNQLIDEYLVKDSISEVWLLFPDPWPKKRHSKRRLINLIFFHNLNKILKKNSTIHIATDSKFYLSDILKCIYEIKSDFSWINQNKEEWDYSNLSLPKTKYFKKALKNGLNPFYIKLLKI